MLINFSKNFVLIILTFLISINLSAGQRKTSAVKVAEATPLRSVRVVTEPKAAVWLDNLRRGTTDENGQLSIEKVGPGPHKLRVRAVGFAEKTQNLLPAQRGNISISLSKTNDAAELAFQQAEVLRESGSDANKQKAIEFYRQALQAKPNFLPARIGLARAFETSDPDEALTQIDAARKVRSNFAETSTVEGRIYRAQEDTENAIKSFRRAIREARINRMAEPEAHTGLALTYRDKGDLAAAIAEFKIAAIQLAETEPVIYQLTGEAYEQMQRRAEAIAAYEKFLQLAPNNKQAPAVRSIIEQLKREDKADTLELMPQ